MEKQPTLEEFKMEKRKEKTEFKLDGKRRLPRKLFFSGGNFNSRTFSMYTTESDL